jgi:hypothetical protein
MLNNQRVTIKDADSPSKIRISASIMGVDGIELTK